MNLTITRDQLDDLVQALDLDDDAIRATYSGRAMYGATCLGIVLDVPDVLVGVALAQVFADDAWDIARAARTDSMGRSTIVYFPGVTVEGATEDDDSDDDE